MKNRTIKSAIYNQLGKKAIPVIIRYRRNSADFIGIETSEKTVYAIKNIFGFYKIVR